MIKYLGVSGLKKLILNIKDLVETTNSVTIILVNNLELKYNSLLLKYDTLLLNYNSLVLRLEAEGL